MPLYYLNLSQTYVDNKIFFLLSIPKNLNELIFSLAKNNLMHGLTYQILVCASLIAKFFIF